MIRLPDGFVPTKWPGYFWHVELQELYSLKSGELLKILKNFKHHKGYTINIGRPTKIPYSYFEALKLDESAEHVIKVRVWNKKDPEYSYFYPENK